MTIHLIPCHSREITKAWEGTSPLTHEMGFIRGRKDGSYKPLSKKTLFYTSFEVLKEITSNSREFQIHWDKKAKF